MAGFMAAVTAARKGLSTALIEPNTFLGGTILAESGVWDDCPTGFTEGSIAAELLTRLTERGGSPGIYQGINHEGKTHGDREWLPQTMLETASDAGIRLYLQSTAAGVIQQEGKVTGITFAGKSGTQALLARQVIDATGNGVLARQMGASASVQHPAVGRSALGLGRVDLEKLLGWAEDKKLLHELCRAEGGRIVRMSFDLPFGGEDIPSRIRLVSNLPGRITQMDAAETALEGEDSVSLAAACIRMNAAAVRLAETMKEKLPGCENSFLDWTSSVPKMDFGGRFSPAAVQAPGFRLTGRASAEGSFRNGQLAGQQAADELKHGGLL